MREHYATSKSRLRQGERLGLAKIKMQDNEQIHVSHNTLTTLVRLKPFYQNLSLFDSELPVTSSKSCLSTCTITITVPIGQVWDFQIE